MWRKMFQKLAVLLLFTVTTGILTFAYFLIYLPQQRDIDQLKSDMSRKDKELEKLRNLIASKDKELEAYRGQTVSKDKLSDKIVNYDKENKKLQEQNKEQERIIADLRDKVTQGNRREQIQEGVKQLQKERTSQKALLDENFENIQKINNPIATFEAKCIPVDRIVEHRSSILGGNSTYTVIKEQDKDSCAKGLALQKEKQLLMEKNAAIQKYIESLDKQIDTLRHQ